MAEKKATEILPQGRWMTECDVVRYNLKMPHELKEQLKKEALKRGMDTALTSAVFWPETLKGRK
jgi:hypothetical protein